MQTRDIVGFVLVPFVILTAILFAEVRVFSGFGVASSILWVLRLVAYSLLLVGATALLCQSAPGRIPIRVVIIVWAATSGLILARFLWAVSVSLDESEAFGPFGPGRRMGAEQSWHHVPDLIGFAVVLLGVFLIPRAAAGKTAEPGAAPHTGRT